MAMAYGYWPVVVHKLPATFVEVAARFGQAALPYGSTAIHELENHARRIAHGVAAHPERPMNCLKIGSPCTCARWIGDRADDFHAMRGSPYAKVAY
jgi:hypothetical protein